jgi:GH15 family glucan-1,4-alpha-glucosidase
VNGASTSPSAGAASATIAAPSLALGVVGNCQVASLVDALGRLVWLCLPRPDGDPVFDALLRRDVMSDDAGVFAIELLDFASASQHYLRNTAVLETQLIDAQGGTVRIVDFCPRFRARGRMFRPMMHVRIVEPVSGRPCIRLRCRPRRAHGAQRAVARAGSSHLAFEGQGLGYRITTDASITALQEGTSFVLESPLAFVLGPDATVEDSPGVLARSLLEETSRYWTDWVRTLAIPFEWQSEVIRAAITLKLCTFEDTGAVLAALTTSIPEAADSGRTWDYRYCWLRDSYFVVHAMNRLGATRTMEAYLHFIDGLITRSNVADLQPLYGLSGEPELLERQVLALEGYRGMGPVRVGNQAADQVQHDVYGSLILAATQLFFDERLIRRGDAALFRKLERIGERAFAVFGEPDAGPWEFRGSMRAHTFSSTMSWAGADRLSRIASRLGEPSAARVWRQRADGLRERLLSSAWNARRNCFTAAVDSDDLDASVLLMAELGLVAPQDPRFVATVDVIGRELTEGPLLYRYRQRDDFGTPETAFTVCAFWYVDALAALGRRDEARERLQALLRFRNPLGLLSEDIAPRSGELWGNFPQTYSLVGLINSALKLSRSWEAAL